MMCALTEVFDDWVTVFCGSKDDYKRQTTNYKHDALIIDLSFGFNLAFAYEMVAWA